MRDQSVIYRQDFPPHRGALQLEDLKKNAQHIRSEVLLVFPVDLGAEVRDLMIVEEMQSRIEVLEIDDTGRSICRRSNLLRNTPRRFLWLLRGSYRLWRFDAWNVVVTELVERVAKMIKILCPQQRQEVIGGIRG